MLATIIASAIGCIIGTFIGRALVDYFEEKGYLKYSKESQNDPSL